MDKLLGLSVTQVPGFEILLQVGGMLLGGAFSVWMMVELYRLLTAGRADFLTPIVRVGAGAVLLGALPEIESFVVDVALGLGGRMDDAHVRHLFVTAYGHALGESASLSGGAVITLLGDLFTLKGLLSLGSVGLYLAMQVMKAVMLDVLWPLCLKLVLILGALAIPLGVLPGLWTLKGWIKNLLEVALWPIVFQLLVGMMVHSFQGLFDEVIRLDLDAVFGVWTQDQRAANSGLAVLMRWWALCVGYLVLLLLTPLIASMAVRSTPVSVVGGLAAAQAARLGGAALGLVSGGAGALVGNLSQTMAQGASGRVGTGAAATLRAAGPPSGGEPSGWDDLGKRRHPGPTGKGPTKDDR